jgi:DNA-binding MarR family transcriptional regulator
MTSSLKARTPGYIIERTAKRLKRAFQHTLASLEADITVDQWVVLDLVQKQPGMSQQDICERSAKDRPTVTRIIDKLEAKMLLERKANAGDRRKFGIYPTREGSEKVKELMPKVEEFRLAHFDGLDDKDVQALLRIMDKINHNISSTQSADHALS